MTVPSGRVIVVDLSVALVKRALVRVAVARRGNLVGAEEHEAREREDGRPHRFQFSGNTVDRALEYWQNAKEAKERKPRKEGRKKKKGRDGLN